MSDFVVVEGLADARNLIYATWLRSYESSSLMTKNIPRDVFFAEHHKVLDRIFARDPIVKLAVMPDSHEVVFGWSVSEPGVIHYVYVKPAFRRHGVARALLEHVKTPFTYSHHTYILRDLHKHVAGSVFNPYAT
jgi:GNAT superfamily N-acetyltransferase